MDIKKIIPLLLVSAIMFGAVSAASVNDFSIDKSYKNIYSSDYYSVNSNGNQDSGVLIFQNVDDDVYDDLVNDDILEGVIHHDGREYIVPDDDLKLDKNSDNTANFTDYDHATHGVSEVVKVDGQEYIVVFWAKDSSSISTGDLISKLTNFNKDNDVDVVAF